MQRGGKGGGKGGENEDKINVFAGPFEKNDINLKIDFLIRNGYTNAQLYP